jgi:hypothetical protein
MPVFPFRVLGNDMRLVFIIMTLLLAALSCAASDDLTAVAEWTWSTDVANRVPIHRLTRTVPEGQPLYLWVRFEGGRKALEYLSKHGKLPIVAQWFWYPLDTAIADTDTPGEFIDPVNLSVGKSDKLRALQREVSQRGWFDWVTWTLKRNANVGYWKVHLVYADSTPVQCQAGVPCAFGIQVR